MADCTTVFDTLKGFLPMNILEKAIDETDADHGTKKFTVLRQLNTMMYAHLTQKDRFWGYNFINKGQVLST